MEFQELTDHDIHTQTITMEKVVRCWVRDGQDVEDIVQDAWLVALEQEGRSIRRLDRWLSGVARLRALRFHRSTANQRTRESQYARPDVAPAADEELGQNETLRFLLGLIEELEEPYRTVLQLRYLDGLSMTELAERRGITTATVRTQLHRARMQLKGRWERSQTHDSPISRFNSWCVLLWDRFAGKSSGRWAARALVAGTVVVAVVVPIRLFAGVSEREIPEVVRAETIGRPAPVDSPRELERLPFPEETAPAAALAGLAMECVWRETGDPAAGISLRVEPADGAADRKNHELETGADGMARLAELPAGVWRIRPETGRAHIVELSGGTIEELRIELPEGRQILVLAERHQKPLAEASIWLSYPGTPTVGRFVGETDGKGELLLGHIESQVWVGARSPGGVSSDLRLVPCARKIKLLVPISPDTIRGRVLDDTGAPIAGARVQTSSMGDGVRHEIHGIMVSSMPCTTIADENGNFELPWWGSVMEILASSEGFFPQAHVLTTRTSRNCTLVLDRSHGYVPDLHELEGTASDELGQALVGWDVYLTPNQNTETLSRIIGFEPKGRRQTRTDESGRFHFEGCPAGTQELTLVDPRDTFKRIVASQDVELGDSNGITLRARATGATATVTGIVGNAKECLSLELFIDSDRLHEPLSFELDSDDRFEIAHLLPGAYRIVCKRVQRPTQILGTCEVRAGDHADLGEMIVKFFGSLRVRLDAPEGQLPERVTLMATYDSWLLSKQVGARAGNYRLDNGYVLADEIPAGSWRIGIYAHGFASSVIDLEVRADEKAQGVVELVPGRNRVLRFQPQRAFSTSDTIHLDVWNESHSSSFSVRVPSDLGGGSLSLSEMLPEGPLYLSARTDSGMVGRTFLDVTESQLTVKLARVTSPAKY